ncbi:flagellar motor switch protein FliG [Rhodopila globiformis]|nr:flagellar motor switch protein FliG [Rhodopila globiformis]
MANVPPGLMNRTMTGLEKAGVLMLALDEERASRLFGMMHEDEIKAISAAMAQLGVVPVDTVERLCTDLVDNFDTSGGILGTYESTEALLLKTLPRDRVAQIMEEIRGPAGRTMWDKLGNVSEELLASYLKNEYPQTVAVVLAMVKPEHSAKVLTLLPDSFGMEVVMRMLRMESIQRDVLDRVERILRAEFMSNLARASTSDAHHMVAEIFNHFDRKAEMRFLAGLEERNRDSAEKVKAQMFTFADLQRLTPPAVQVLLRAVDKSQLPLALKGAPENIRTMFMSQLSERAGKMLREEIAALGPVRMKDVEEAQAAISNLAKDLAARGEIDISPVSDDRVIE